MPDLDAAQRAVKLIDEMRIEQILRETKALIPEAKEKGCGFYLVTTGGWLSSVRVDESVPKNTLHWEER